MRAALKALVLPAALLVAAEAAVRISGTTSQAIADGLAG